MARVTMTISAHFTPAYWDLLNAAEAIKEAHGADRAAAWAQRALEIDFDVFCEMRVGQAPALRLIRGGVG